MTRTKLHYRYNWRANCWKLAFIPASVTREQLHAQYEAFAWSWPRNRLVQRVARMLGRP